MSRQAVTIAFLVAACSSAWGSPGVAQIKPKGDPLYKYTEVLVLGPIAGSTVAVIPLAQLIIDPAMQLDSALFDHRRALRWADSLVAEALLERGSEVNWILPAQLRKVAQRGLGLVPDPDQMGQSIHANQKIVDVPPALQNRLHSLASVVSARYALVPASLDFGPASTGGVNTMLYLVMTDIRTGRVVYRTQAPGTASSFASALRSAMATVLPVDMPGQ